MEVNDEIVQYRRSGCFRRRDDEKSGEDYAVAVRKPDHEIEVKVSDIYNGIIKNRKYIRNMPIYKR